MRTATSLSVLLLLLVIPLPAAAQDQDGPRLEATLDLFGHYVWRGWDLNHGDPALQPGIVFPVSAFPGFYLELWGSLGLGRRT